MALCIFVIHCKPPFIKNIPMLVPFQIHFKMSSLTGGYTSSNLWLYSLSVKSQGHKVCLIDLKLSVHPFSSNVADALATFKSDAIILTTDLVTSRLHEIWPKISDPMGSSGLEFHDGYLFNMYRKR